jgi:nitrogenase molybdenum-cofactor synthesis protein NifE
MPFLDINQEREFGYAGYDGMLELARQICLTIESPIWDAVRSAPPWAATATSPAAGSAPESVPLSSAHSVNRSLLGEELSHA